MPRAKYEKKQPDKQELHYGYYGEEYQKIYAEFGREVRLVEGVNSERGLAYEHQYFRKSRDDLGLHGFKLDEQESRHRRDKHNADCDKRGQKSLHIGIISRSPSNCNAFPLSQYIFLFICLKRILTHF